MIIAWWHKEHLRRIELIEDDALPWINANWIEHRQALPAEIKMYNNGIYSYKIGEIK